MRCWLYLVIAGCGANAEPAPKPAPVTPAATARLASARPPTAPLTAAHGPEIVTLDVTDDGAVAVSADRLGGIRLWPALDGSREPVVIHGAAPRALAVTRDGAGLAIFVQDGAGGVEVIRTTAAGAVTGRGAVGGDQPASELVGTPDGALILRADQVLELAGPDGAVRGRLVPEPGTHIASLVGRGARVAALVLDGKRYHVRHIVLDRGARWGTSSAGFETKIARAALSPSGKLLAIAHPRSLRPQLVDLATGVVQKSPVCVPAGWPNADGDTDVLNEMMRSGNAPVPLGFLTELRLACAVSGSLTWWQVAGDPWQGGSTSVAIGTAPVAMFDGGVVVGAGPSLGIATPLATRYLGYGIHDVTRIHGSNGTLLVVGQDPDAFVLDGSLRERARVSLARSRLDRTDVVMLDDRYGLQAQRIGERSQLSTFDGVTGVQLQQLPYAAGEAELSYEPSTHLLATSDGAAQVLARYEPSTHSFGPPIRLRGELVHSRVALLDPALAHGVAALQLAATSDGLIVGELYPEDLKPGTTVAPRTSYRVVGAFRAVDRAGRLYLQDPAHTGDVLVLEHGKPGPRLPGVAALTVRPNRDGSWIAAFGAPRLAMLTGQGAIRWDTAQWAAGAIAWTVDGDLAVQFPTGILKLAADTGAPVARRCGWSFGLTEDAPASRGGLPGEAASICEREPAAR